MKQIGGINEKEKHQDNQNFPNGGFPPLVLCKDIVVEKKDTRSFKTSSDLVSINKILEKKKNTNPFFSI